MMLRWTSEAVSDLERLHNFLALVNETAAAEVIAALTLSPHRLIDHPRMGEKLEKYSPREVRRLIIQHYEIRYEIIEQEIYLIRIWHTRERR